MDLSHTHRSAELNPRPIIKPIPRHPWPTVWYRTMWPAFAPHRNIVNHQIQTQTLSLSFPSWNPKAIVGNCSRSSTKSGFAAYKPTPCENLTPTTDEPEPKPATVHQKMTDKELLANKMEADEHQKSSGPRIFMDITSASNYGQNPSPHINGADTHSLLDIATCDGPVYFERVSNPNFALTVQHCCLSTKTNATFGTEHEHGTNVEVGESTSGVAVVAAAAPVSKSKIYTCIYCHQSFKSLFCYQKHKKRHINPVSVDLTTGEMGMAVNNSENNNIQDGGTTNNNIVVYKPQTAKYLNVQFFPCKICGCKFPSYYFVHKHIKLCH